MARSVNGIEYTSKRNKILDVVLKLIASKGYEEMTIQDILDELKISKGAFFHYFSSKQALLEALVERLLDEIEERMAPVVSSDLSAIDKLEDLFKEIIEIKAHKSKVLMPLLHIWYSDSNALLRQKIRMAKVDRLKSFLIAIIKQGVDENTMDCIHPDQTGEVILFLVLDLADSFSRIIINSGSNNISCIKSIASAYTHAIERILGMSKNSFVLIDSRLMMEFLSPNE